MSACTLTLPGHTATWIAAVAVEQASPPAVADAVVVIEVGLTTTVAVSCSPMLSVTVSVAVARPHAGGVTVAVAELVPDS
jgi:hypothetical protein